MEPSTREPHHAAVLAEQIGLLTGADGWHTAALPRVRPMRLSDGPVGVRGGGFERPRRGALLPNPALLASSWDRELLRRAGLLLGFEARDAGVDWVLAPMLNLPRTPLGGRSFESLSEDPVLTAEMGLAMIRGIQATGVAATAKHFIANESETERLGYDVRVSERTLRQRYLLPFEVAVTEGAVAAVMASYNSVNGELATESTRLLREILREEWGFDGVVVSDWGAARSTEATILAGLDLAMPGPDGPWGERLAAAVSEGRVPERAVRDAAERIIALAERSDPAKAKLVPFGEDERRAILREAAVSGSVLLSNRGGLPLGGTRSGAGGGALPCSIAVIGPGAVELCQQGGGSAGLLPRSRTELADALRARLGNRTRVVVEAGARIGLTLPLLAPERARGEIELVFLSVSGRELERRPQRRSHVVVEHAPEGTARVELRVSVDLAEPGAHRIAIRGSGSFELSVNGVLMANPVIPEPQRDPLSPLVEPGEYRLEIASGEHELVLGLAWEADADWHILGLGHEAPGPGAEALLAAAEAAARDAEAVVLVVGTTAEYETEGIDRRSLALPGRQDELVRLVCAANPRTVVVLNTGSPVLIPWAEQPAAVLWAGFPGQEGGEAIADLLLGFEEPGGRLSMTVPGGEAGLPSTVPVDGTLAFEEEERIGYRSHLPATFPFGHGLGYTDWSYERATAELDGDDVRVTTRLRNVGGRRGREVVQLYLRDGDGDSGSSGAALRLVGFADCTADPGESVELQIPIRARELREWGSSGWRRRSGHLRLEVGRSSADLRLSVGFRLPDAAHHPVPPR